VCVKITYPKGKKKKIETKQISLEEGGEERKSKGGMWQGDRREGDGAVLIPPKLPVGGDSLVRFSPLKRVACNWLYV